MYIQSGLNPLLMDDAFTLFDLKNRGVLNMTDSFRCLRALDIDIEDETALRRCVEGTLRRHNFPLRDFQNDLLSKNLFIEVAKTLYVKEGLASNIMKGFIALDEKGHGELSEADLQSISKELPGGPNFTAVKLNHMMRYCDLDGDHRINWNDFCRCVTPILICTRDNEYMAMERHVLDTLDDLTEIEKGSRIRRREAHHELAASRLRLSVNAEYYGRMMIER